MTIEATFRAGGLASGLDSNSIIDQLVNIEKAPITRLQKQQSSLKTQVSDLGALASRLSSLQSAVDGLRTNGVLALRTLATPEALSATPTTSGTAGRYAVQVDSLASAAKARSQVFGSAFDSVTGGTLDLTVMGTAWSVALTDGMTLTDVATAINASGAPVGASILNTGTQSYLSLTNRDTGFPLTGTASDALQITETSTGSLGSPLALTVTQPATNAQLQVDGVTIQRTTNEISDVVPGMRLSLQKTSSAPEDLVVGYDTTGTQSRLQGFVDAYNNVQRMLQAALNPAANTDRASTLSGDATVRTLQQALQRLTSAVVPGLGTVRSLADLGVATQRDGTLTLDSTKLAAAVGRDPSAVDALFTTKTTGLTDVVDQLVKGYTDPISGMLSARQTGLGSSIKGMDDQIAAMNARVVTFKATLIAQFTAMENVVSGLKSVGNFLNSWSAGLTSGSTK